MWAWRSVLCVSLVCGLALDSNTIRSSKEVPQSSELPDRFHGDQTQNSNSRHWTARVAPNCNTQLKGGCSNHAQRRPSSSDRVPAAEQEAGSLNRTKAPEMSSCVRSGDCAVGLCCVRYLTGKRCQRIPGEGEACLPRGSSKTRRKLGRCDCEAGLTCTAVSRTEQGKTRRQGVCLPRAGQRRTRHSGKKRRTAETVKQRGPPERPPAAMLIRQEAS